MLTPAQKCHSAPSFCKVLPEPQHRAFSGFETRPLHDEQYRLVVIPAHARAIDLPITLITERSVSPSGEEQAR